MRFTKISGTEELLRLIENAIKNEYRKIPDSTGGDMDFLVIDNLYKEYIWCENGFYPFCQDESELNSSDYDKQRLASMDKTRS